MSTVLSPLAKLKENSSQPIRITLKKQINRLDLSLICKKLMHSSGKGWTNEQTEKVKRSYKEFLYISFLYKDKVTIVPTEEVDTFWHYHILDTKKYFNDCMNTFGEIIHHSPYMGLDEETGEQELTDAFDDTNKMYLKEFGQPLPKGVKAAFCNVPPPK